MIDLSMLRNVFAEFSSENPRIFSAPGRVNLIGEHTDYNQGFVLPMAANLRTYVAAGSRADGLVRVNSLNIGEVEIFPLNISANRSKRAGQSWAFHVQGMVHALVSRGMPFEGADLVVSSEVPIGAGLSSSAALEISVGLALVSLASFDLSPLELALAAHQTEHQFVGTNSGLMDQLTATFGEREHAMLIDCRTLERRLISMKSPDTAVVVCDTKVKHALVKSAYNERRRECERALELLKPLMESDICSLRDLSVNELGVVEELPDPERRRARHVITENQRTLDAAAALEANDIGKVGALMTRSHESLRDDFEVSCAELDLMFDLAMNRDGVAGARMMGGGFGGSTVNLVERTRVADFTSALTEGYVKATGLNPMITVVQADEGMTELSF